MDNKRQGMWALSTNPDESFRQYRKLYMAELKKANDNTRARQIAREKYLAQMYALRERIELESHFLHCRYCGRRWPEKPRRHEDLICIFCLAELNNLPEEKEQEKIETDVNKYLSPNSPHKTNFLLDAQKEQIPSPTRISGRDSPFIAYGDTR